MAELYGSHFEYGGILSRKYKLILCSAETKRNSQLSGKMEGVTIYHKAAKSRHLVGNNYSGSPISYSIEIAREDGDVIPTADRREIEKWLFNRSGYRKLYIDMEDDPKGETYEFIDGIQKRLYLNCRFVNPSKLEYFDGVVGYSATLEADGGYWWQDPVEKTFTSPFGTVLLTVDSDIDDYIYPEITIEVGNAGGDITINNNTDKAGRVFPMIGLEANSTIVINGEMNYIGGDASNIGFDNMDIYNKIDEMTRLRERVDKMLRGNCKYATRPYDFLDATNKTVIVTSGYSTADVQPASQGDIDGGEYYELVTDTDTVNGVRIFKFEEATEYNSTVSGNHGYYVKNSGGKRYTMHLTKLPDEETGYSELTDAGTANYATIISAHEYIEDVLAHDVAEAGLVLHIVEGGLDADYWASLIDKEYEYNVAILRLEDDIKNRTRKGDGTTLEIKDILYFYNVLSNLIGKSGAKAFPRLLDGENEIEITGSVNSVTFKYQNRRML